VSVREIVFQNRTPGAPPIVVCQPIVLTEKGVRIGFDGSWVEITADEWQNIGNLFLGPVE